MMPANDPGVPLCFDTSAVRGFRAGAELLRSCKATWPERQIVLPAIVVAEQVRHWMVRKTTPFNASEFQSFLADYEVVGFDSEVALTSWHSVLCLLRPEGEPWVWRYDQREAPLSRGRKEACAQVCRWPDHAICAIARRHGALLVTNDHELRNTLRGRVPGAIEVKEIERWLKA